MRGSALGVATLLVATMTVGTASAAADPPADPLVDRHLSAQLESALHGSAQRAAALRGSALHASAQRAALPDNVRFYQKRISLLGRHVWYRQVKNGRPVVGGWYARHFMDGRLVRVYDGRRRVSGRVAARPRIDAEVAIGSALTTERASNPGDSQLDSVLMVLPAGHGNARSRLVWAVTATTGRGVQTSYVDARNGAVLGQERISQYAEGNGVRTVTGRGRVFDPNPVVSLQRPDLRDRRDQTTRALRRAYVVVDLPRLRRGRGLVGRWAQLTNRDLAESRTNRYIYTRTQERFEQVVAYHGAHEAQAYLQRLGFTDANAESQRLLTNRETFDNSFYNPRADLISFGSGGVDDAEDVEIIWHEYAHAMQDDQVPDFGRSPQAGAIGEGFGDYFAVTMSEPRSTRSRVTPLSCVGDWDAVSYDRTRPHCLRRVDTRLQFEDRNGEVHHDGQIWSRALWDIRNSVARRPGLSARAVADRLVVEAHFWMHQRVTMTRAAQITVWVAKELYGARAAATTRAAFVDRHILS